jgi:hypothetical protein
MVTIGINNGHPVDGIGLAQIFNHNGFNIDIAKPSGPVHNAHGVMPRWSDEGEPPINLSVEYCHTDGLGTTSTDEMRFGRNTPYIRDAKMDSLDIL